MEAKTIRTRRQFPHHHPEAERPAQSDPGRSTELSKIESGRVSFKEDPLDLRSLIERTLDDRPLADKKGTSWSPASTTPSRRSPETKADSRRS